jgi:hypothetical protein
MSPRPKTAPTRRPEMRSNISYDADNPGLTGQFPSTNYTRVVDPNRYNYPPPESKEPTRKPFPDMTTPDTEKPTIFPGNGANTKYGPFSSDPLNLSGRRGFSFNGFPSWAVPSSVFPHVTPPKARKTQSDDFEHKWNGLANESASNIPSTFSADEWHQKLSAENIFRPPDEAQMRKSPSKTSRTSSKPTARARAQSRTTDDIDSEKASAFQPGKLPNDWATRATRATAKNHSPDSVDSRDKYVVVEEDVMDVDTPPTNSATNGLKHTATSEAVPAETKRRSSHGGVDLREFTQQAPFAPTSGLGGLKDDLETHLPFESRAADAQSQAARLRALKLPHPPRGVVPPAPDLLDKNNFAQYVENMQIYIREWNTFNARMIEHFRSRQDRVCGTMSANWISQLGDGPNAEILDLEEGADKQAGYGAYMQWLKDDAQCRDWWEEANEKHLHCLEDLGRTREVAKKKLRS